VGSGAVFFHVAQNYPIKQFAISDTNQELVVAYLTIQQQVELLIDYLIELEQAYHRLNREAQQEFFYTIRSTFNRQRGDLDLESRQREPGRGQKLRRSRLFKN